MCVNGAVIYVSLFGVGSWGPQSCQWLVLPSVFLTLPLQHAPCPAFLHHLFSLSPVFSNSPSLMVSFSQNINILKNFLSSVLSSPLPLMESYLNEYPLSSSSPPRLTFATAPMTICGAVTNLSGEKFPVNEASPYFALHFFHLSF